MDEVQPSSDASASSDPVTELQTCLDQLALQFYASLRYVTTHHPVAPPATIRAPATATSSSPPPDPPPTGASGRATPGPAPGAETPRPSEAYSPSHTPGPDAAAFGAETRELARDLVLKQRQIEGLLAQLPPDLAAAEAAQAARLRELEQQLAAMETEGRRRWEAREELLARVDGAIARCKRVV